MPAQEPAPAPPPPVQAPPPPPPPPPPQPSEDLQIAQLELERLIEEQAAGLGDKIAARYDEEIRSLREQLKAAQAAEDAALAAALEESPQADGTPPATDTGSAAPASSVEPPAVEPPADEPPADEFPGEAAETSPTEPPAPAEAADVEPIASEPSPADVAPEPAPPPQVEPPPPQIEPPPPQIEPPPPPTAPVVIPPQRLSLPEPRYPVRAQQQNKEATVLIKVLVDTRGKVLDAQPVVNKPDPYGFFREALNAARKAQFKPALSDGKPIQMWTTVVIAFKMKS